MPQTKIQGKFYPLKSSEWIDSINQLTHSELKILYYVRSLDPYNNGIDLSASQIARDLSTDKNKMHRSTVGRALKSLDRKGFINMELIKVRIKVNPRGFLNDLEAESEPKSEAQSDVVATQPCCDHATNVVTTQQSVQPRNKVCSHATGSAPTQQPKAETQSEQKVKKPKIYKTYLDFKDFLSEGERENFFNFVRKKAENLEKPINDLEAWLASENKAKQNRWEIYYRNYQEEKLKENRKPTRQGNNSGNYTPQKLQDVIKRFQNRGRTGALEPEKEPEEVDREEIKRQQAEIDRLMDNPPEYETRKSPAQQRREAIAEARRKQSEWNLERKRLDAERQRQWEMDEPDPAERTARMIREAEELLRNRQQQNPEIDEEGLENE